MKPGHHQARTLPVLLILLFSCTSSHTEIPVFVSAQADPVERRAAGVLSEYLAELYPGYDFPVTCAMPDAAKFILLSSDKSWIDKQLTPAGRQSRHSGDDQLLSARRYPAVESFSVSHRKLNGQTAGIIYGRDPKGVLNGVYGLLEELGYGFYLSLECKPPVRSGFDFAGWDFSDSPLAEERMVFNWHNFLSGCSAWGLPEWKAWIERSAQMRFNTVMVHAYGNNPMFTYSFNGRQKKTSRMPATQGGRDYGTQQVNDVRRLHGGGVFDHPVFGAEASRVGTEQQVEAAQRLMEQVFDYAEELGMRICFAFDIDTSPANPQELINILSPPARFCIPLEQDPYAGRYEDTLCLADPETPRGYAFYKAQIVSLLERYPQIDQVALWMRKSGSEWLSLRPDQLPPGWQAEYKKVIKQHPGASAWEEAPGRFALGKVAAAFQRALKETGREDVVLKAGSWAFDWMEPADVFFPKDIGFIGLDYNVLQGDSDIDLPEQQERLARISENRPVTPVFWAHHDDGAYMGRPYAPVRDLQKKLERTGTEGFGIIHWTTWPLDPYFKNMALQVWERSLNQDYQITTGRMAGDLFGGAGQEKMPSYLYQWATAAPMMGRETREWFIDHAFTEQEVQEVAEGCRRRLNLLEAVDEQAFSETGKKYLRYFKGLEAFSRDFYRMEHAYQQSLKYKAEGAIAKAADAVRQCKPEQLLARYAGFSAEKGITKGEKGVLISLNLGWLPFIENQRQALGQSPIRCNFAPTVHPRFGQGLLRTGFFMDTGQNLWRNYGREETGAYAYELSNRKLPPDDADSIPGAYREICRSGIESKTTIRFNLQPVMADIKPFGPTRDRVSAEIRPGRYRLQLLFAPALTGETKEENIQTLFVYNRRGQPAIITERLGTDQQTGGKHDIILKTYEVPVPRQGEVIIELEPVKGKANICGAVLNRE